VGGFLVERLTGEVVNADPENPTGSGSARVYLSGDTIYLQEKIAGVWTNTGTSWDV